MTEAIPRFGEIAARLAENGYAPLPLHFGDKLPCAGYGWQNYKLTPEDLRRYSNRGTGILCGKVVGLDIDIRDPALSAQLEAIAEDMFGPAPRRIGQAPKVLRILQAEQPFSKVQTRDYRLHGDGPEEKAQKVEVLATGQQFVAYNKHPVTHQAYQWNGIGDPLTVPIGMLPVMSEVRAREFVAIAEKLLAQHGTPISKMVEADEAREHEPNEQQRAADPELLRQALAAIPNDELQFDDWLHILYAVKGAIGESGLPDFLAWSAKATKDDPEFSAREFLAAKPRRYGAGTIYFVAKRHGWQRPQSVARDRATPSDGPPPDYEPEYLAELQSDSNSTSVAITTEDFYAYMPTHEYMFTPTRELWPGASVKARCALPRAPDGSVITKQVPKSTKNEEPEFKEVPMPAAEWLDTNRPVDQMSWAPGEPMVISDRLVSWGGWIARPGCHCFNLYRAPEVQHGNKDAASPWIEHIGRVFPENSDHIVRWLAHRVQFPGDKVNHAIVLGGAQGIGKDALLEPVKHAVGHWNFAEVTPTQLLGRFNGFVKSVILRISEARDLGETDRYSFYEHTKVYTAAPPDVIRCDEKHLREHAVMNVCGVVITSNHKTDGIYLPADDRRHYVAWSALTKTDFTEEYWKSLYGWYRYGGGVGHVAAYLATLDLSAFDAKAPPPKTSAFYEIADANRAPEDAELADVLEALGNRPAVTLTDLVDYAGTDFKAWLQDRKNRRQMPHRLETAGYVPVRNQNAADGLWVLYEKRQVVYARKDLPLRDQLAAASALGRSGRQ
jgi:hypothetical protein